MGRLDRVDRLFSAADGALRDGGRALTPSEIFVCSAATTIPSSAVVRKPVPCMRKNGHYC